MRFKVQGLGLSAEGLRHDEHCALASSALQHTGRPVPVLSSTYPPANPTHSPHQLLVLDPAHSKKGNGMTFSPVCRASCSGCKHASSTIPCELRLSLRSTSRSLLMSNIRVGESEPEDRPALVAIPLTLTTFKRARSVVKSCTLLRA